MVTEEEKEKIIKEYDDDMEIEKQILEDNKEELKAIEESEKPLFNLTKWRKAVMLFFFVIFFAVFLIIITTK